jgi:osmoprotectant transport system permease protein
VKEQLALLPGYLLAHVQLVVIALGVCFALSVPLGIYATRKPRFERLLVGIASTVQTIPSLALLAVMVPLLGALGAPAIGAVPALLGLTMYCALPILLSTITAIRETDPAVLEAARGVGMTDWQQLRLVELPLALPFIVAGTRTAAVWCVGMATLSTPVGAPSLGNFIFGGLQTGNRAATLLGCVGSAALALLLDRLVLLVERGLRRRERRAMAAGLLGLAGLGVLTLTTLTAGAFATASRPQVVRIGAKTFTESLVLAHALAARAEADGAQVQVLESLGSSVVFDALAAGELDAYVDYTGTLATTALRHEQPVLDRAQLLSRLKAELSRRFRIEVAAALGFENTYAIAVRDQDAELAQVRKLSELGDRSERLVIGGDYEFFQRKEWTNVRDGYRLRFREQRSMDPALMYGAIQARAVDAISAYSTDGRIATFRLRVLQDDRRVIPPYDAVVLVSQRLARTRPKLLAAFRALEGTVSAEAMRELNRQVDELGRTPRDVGRELARSW